LPRDYPTYDSKGRVKTFKLGERTLEKGSDGEDVKELQRRLRDLGYNPGAIDGDFGSKTRSAVKDFQRAQGLEADGIVGRKTINALNATRNSGGTGTVEMKKAITSQGVQLNPRTLFSSAGVKVEQQISVSVKDGKGVSLDNTNLSKIGISVDGSGISIDNKGKVSGSSSAFKFGDFTFQYGKDLSSSPDADGYITILAAKSTKPLDSSSKVSCTQEYTIKVSSQKAKEAGKVAVKSALAAAVLMLGTYLGKGQIPPPLQQAIDKI